MYTLLLYSPPDIEERRRGVPGLQRLGNFAIRIGFSFAIELVYVTRAAESSKVMIFGQISQEA